MTTTRHRIPAPASGGLGIDGEPWRRAVSRRYNWVMQRVVVGVAVATMVWVAGCTPAAEPQARAAAAAFQGAVDRGDSTAACELLSEAARENLESASVTRCAEALTRLELPTGSVAEVAVWGGNAQGRLGSGVLFLAEFGSGWKVTAAGCTFRSEKLPYACAVKG